MRHAPLLTDLYELTMLAGYLEQGMHDLRQCVVTPNHTLRPRKKNYWEAE